MSGLLIPLVSTGNVPQLSTDLILHSLSPDFQYVCELENLYLFPFVGPLDYVEGREPELYKANKYKKYTTPIELFYNEKLQLYVIQQRVPVFQGYENNFCKELLVPLVKKLGVEAVFVLDSIDALEETISNYSNRLNRFSLGICDLSKIDNIATEFQQTLQLEESEAHSVNKTLFDFTEDSFQLGISTDQFVFKLCYHLLHASPPLPNLKRIKYMNVFVQEGDNSEDAVFASKHLRRLVDNFPAVDNFVVPVSWKGVYGVRDVPSCFEEGLYI
ncbi:LAFE_0C12024g1_1 [Lachancea fermentati]|uniref:Proteasome assembly chaperone 2 n=1 Tax=Lachancea fermentati TaxID=4955 RepID=A0A1G4MA80_LACFM|nr:LAFE_0C12024g1_1 [Lachancea fermentati]